MGGFYRSWDKTRLGKDKAGDLPEFVIEHDPADPVLGERLLKEGVDLAGEIFDGPRPENEQTVADTSLSVFFKFGLDVGPVDLP